MELDFSEEWRVLHASAPGSESAPSAFAAAELAAVLGRMGCRPPVPGGEGDTERIIVLHAGSRKTEGRRSYSWRASADRVEIYGADGASLLAAVYDFLGALGARWPAPGAEGERLPAGPSLRLGADEGSSNREALPAALALGHGAFLERYEDYLAWAARAGYSSILIRVTRNDLALEGAPERLYESLRAGIAKLARRLGLSLELGGEELGAASLGGIRDRAAEAFAEYAVAHPEISVFQLWPEEPWGGGARAPARRRSPAPIRLEAARELAAALERARPDASLSMLADEEDGALPGAILEARTLPPNLGLLWAPRHRSWGAALGARSSPLNAASLALFRESARAWRRLGGGRVAVLERYEDAFLFKGAAPPFGALIEEDLAAYRDSTEGGGADAIGLLCGGGRLPLGFRPNPALLPALAADPRIKAEAAADEWAKAAYGAAEAPMREYWSELAAAWAIDLDLVEGEAEVHAPESLALASSDPPADWGDPWKAGVERLAAKRERCEELFDHLRRAEMSLAGARDASFSTSASDAASASAAARAVKAESDEYAISGSILELNCARLSSYHELAAGDAPAAADIANLALSASAALRKALSLCPDPRARRETRLAVSLFYELRLRELRRFNARSAVRRLLDLWSSRTRIAVSARRASRAYEPTGSGPEQGLARSESGH
jgi:hypothetical protein